MIEVYEVDFKSLAVSRSETAMNEVHCLPKWNCIPRGDDL